MRRRSRDIGNGIMNATDGHSQGGGVEKVGATRGHNTPRVEASPGRRLSGGGGGVVIKLFSKSGLRGGIESKSLLPTGVRAEVGATVQLTGVGAVVGATVQLGAMDITAGAARPLGARSEMTPAGPPNVWVSPLTPPLVLGRRQQACQSLAVYYTSLVQT
jgi:hypothetical protein